MQARTNDSVNATPGYQFPGDVAWSLVRAAADAADQRSAAGEFAAFTLAEDGAMRRLPAEHPDALVAWQPGVGWESMLPIDDARHALLDLYLPICSATTEIPITIGHLGQSLDGFIATHTGDSQFVTGRENILHLHRMRALCDAVVVGAGTVAADDPQLNTRLVPGPNPMRVVFDPTRRLSAGYRVFSDDLAPTLYACAGSLVSSGETRVGTATIVPLDDEDDVSVSQLMRILRERGCRRIFVEGGGVTVSAFLEANLLDRLHVAIAPLIIGDGRPAIRLPARAALSDCHRPRYRVFRMGGDVLFDCDLSSPGTDGEDTAIETPQVSRII